MKFQTVCRTCGHHLASHKTSYPMPCKRRFCNCEKFKVINCKYLLLNLHKNITIMEIEKRPLIKWWWSRLIYKKRIEELNVDLGEAVYEYLYIKGRC